MHSMKTEQFTINWNNNNNNNNHEKCTFSAVWQPAKMKNSQPISHPKCRVFYHVGTFIIIIILGSGNGSGKLGNYNVSYVPICVHLPRYYLVSCSSLNVYTCGAHKTSANTCRDILCAVYITVCNPYAQNSHGEIVNSNKMMKKPNKKPCFEVNTMHFTFTWITNQFKGNFGAVAFTFYALHSHCIGERRHNVCRWVFQKKLSTIRCAQHC